MSIKGSRAETRERTSVPSTAVLVTPTVRLLSRLILMVPLHALFARAAQGSFRSVLASIPRLGRTGPSTAIRWLTRNAGKSGTTGRSTTKRLVSLTRQSASIPMTPSRTCFGAQSGQRRSTRRALPTTTWPYRRIPIWPLLTTTEATPGATRRTSTRQSPTTTLPLG